VALVHKKDLKKENTKEIKIRIIVYAKNSLQQLKLSNIQRDGFTIYYYYFYTNMNKLKRYITIVEKNNNQWKIDA